MHTFGYVPMSPVTTHHSSVHQLLSSKKATAAAPLRERERETTEMRDLSMAGKLGHMLTRLHLARRSRSPSSSSVADVPRGHLAVYVGEGRKRLVIPTACLSHPAFVTLLKRVEDEFGFDHRCGGLTIPCASETEFAHIVGAAVDMHHR